MSIEFWRNQLASHPLRYSVGFHNPFLALCDLAYIVGLASVVGVRKKEAPFLKRRQLFDRRSEKLLDFQKVDEDHVEPSGQLRPALAFHSVARNLAFVIS